LAACAMQQILGQRSALTRSISVASRRLIPLAHVNPRPASPLLVLLAATVGTSQIIHTRLIAGHGPSTARLEGVTAGVIRIPALMKRGPYQALDFSPAASPMLPQAANHRHTVASMPRIHI
jgi:hypothetical protein